MRSAVETVQAWHDAVNARDIDAALACCRPDVVVGGPRGDGEGHDLMRAWLQRSGIELEPQEPLEERDGRVVVHELARWRTADAPAEVPSQEPAETWVVFETAEGLVSAVRRYETADQVPSA